MNYFIIIFFVAVFNFGCAQIGVVAGYNRSGADGLNGMSHVVSDGFEFGYISKGSLRSNELWTIKSGLQFTKRSLIVESSQGSGRIDFVSLELPLLYEYQPFSNFYIGGGGRISTSTSTACDFNDQPCSVPGSKKTLFFAEIEGGYKISDSWEANIFGQESFGNLYDSAKNAWSTGIRLIFLFDKKATKEKLNNFIKGR